MIKKIIIAGFGGQGIILLGRLLAYAAMLEGKEVTHFPSYGAEMRGGTCQCSVVISDSQIASPVINNPDIALIFNKPSMDKFESKCKKDGIIFLNSTLINEKVNRSDLQAYYVDATKIADSLGNTMCTNMIILGLFAKVTRLVKLDTLIESLNEIISKRNKQLIELNTLALKKGYDL